MPSPFMLKIIGGVAGLLIVLGLFLGLRHYKHLAEERGAKLATICETTRTAAANPKLACGQVPTQITELGNSVKSLKSAISNQNAAVNAWAAESDRQKSEAATAVSKAATRARGAEATAERLRASSRSTVPSRGSEAACKPSKELERNWK